MYFIISVEIINKFTYHISVVGSTERGGGDFGYHHFWVLGDGCARIIFH